MFHAFSSMKIINQHEMSLIKLSAVSFKYQNDCNQWWRWRQHSPLERWYPTTTLHGVTTQKTTTCLLIALQTSNFEQPVVIFW